MTSRHAQPGALIMLVCLFVPSVASAQKYGTVRMIATSSSARGESIASELARWTVRSLQQDERMANTVGVEQRIDIVKPLDLMDHLKKLTETSKASKFAAIRVEVSDERGLVHLTMYDNVPSIRRLLVLVDDLGILASEAKRLGAFLVEKAKTLSSAIVEGMSDGELVAVTLWVTIIAADPSDATVDVDHLQPVQSDTNGIAYWPPTVLPRGTHVLGIQKTGCTRYRRNFEVWRVQPPPLKRSFDVVLDCSRTPQR